MRQHPDHQAADHPILRSPTRQKLSLWLPVVGYMVAIFVVSSISDPPAPTGVPDVDLHAVVYGGLMLVTLRALAGGRWRGVSAGRLCLAWIVTVAYGLTDEWHQMYVPNRHAEWRDVGANAIGALVAGVLAGAWSIIRR